MRQEGIVFANLFHHCLAITALSAETNGQLLLVVTGTVTVAKTTVATVALDNC